MKIIDVKDITTMKGPNWRMLIVQDPKTTNSDEVSIAKAESDLSFVDTDLASRRSKRTMGRF